jgi:hypothetical protein
MKKIFPGCWYCFNSDEDATEKNRRRLSPFITVNTPFIVTGEATRSCHFISLTSDEHVTPRDEHPIKDRQTACYITALDPYKPNRRILHCLTRISEKIHYAYTLISVVI